jgi:hypothetical protein
MLLESRTDLAIQKQILIGMQNAGKSTFIAALFHVVESGQVKEALQLVELGENREYLIDLRDRWLDCLELDRTKLGEEKFVTLRLIDPLSRQTTELIVPDVSGETFRDQWEKRKTTKVFDEVAREASGALLFVHPDMIRNPVRINENKQIASVLTPSESDEAAIPSPAAQTPVEWSPKFSPTQVKLIELLQILMREPHVYPLSKIAIIISAWDLVSDEYKEPSRWLAAELPMFHQFLRSNFDRVSHKVFGISAQGGPLNQEALLRTQHQAERIDVVTDIPEEYSHHDITAPIKWLMTNEGS